MDSAFFECAECGNVVKKYLTTFYRCPICGKYVCVDCIRKHNTENTTIACPGSGGAAVASSVNDARFAELEKRIDFAENMARNTIRQGCVIGAQLDKLAEHVNFSFQEKAADEEYEEDEEDDDESEEAS